MRRGTALSLSLVMALSGVPTQALAETANLLGEAAGQSVPSTSADLVGEASGKWGTCNWDLDIEGLLTVYPGEGEDTEGECPWGEFSDSITKVVFLSDETGKVVLPSDSSYLFADMDRLNSVDLAGVEASKVTDMDSMFYGCSSLASVNLSGLDTSKVENMKFMFADCLSLDSLDLSGWNTSSLVNMYWMFAECSSLESLDLSDLDTSKVKDMEGMFYDCDSLPSLDLSGWNTSSVTSMRCMFRGCSSLASLDLSTFDTSNVTDMNEMFHDCSSLASLDFSTFDSSKVTFMGEMFRGCSKLSTITVGKGWSTASLKNAFFMFEDCDSLVGDKGTAYSRSHMGSDYARVDAPDTPGYLTAKIVVSGTWGTCPWEIDAMGVLTVHPGEGEDTASSSPWSKYRSSITKVVFAADEEGNKVILPSDLSDLFLWMEGVTSVDLRGTDASKVTNMDSVFYGCSSLESLDLSGLDTSKVTNMKQLFAGCSSLASLDLAGWNTSSVTSMRCMFEGCTKLASIDFSDFDTSNVVTMNYMFRSCPSLTSLDLSSFDTSKVTGMSCMFRSCPELKTITVGKGWNTASVKEDFFTFNGCNSLVGGNGTKYSSDHASTDYARVDKLDAPGYLTLKVVPAFESANLTVGDKIGLTFWLALPGADGLDYGDAYVELSVEDRSGHTERVDLTDETPRDGEGRYGFTIDLTSVEMAEPVTATFHYSEAGEEKTVSMDCSVQEYFEAFDKVASSYPEKTVAFVQATADLGYYMQPYLARANKWDIGDDYARISKRYSEAMDFAAAEAGLSSYGMDAELGSSGVKASVSASFDSLIAVNVFLSAPDGADLIAEAEYGETTHAAVKLPDGRWLVRVEGIRPQHFDQPITVTGTCNGEKFTVEASVLGLLNAGFSKADNLTKAAFASAYFDWQAAKAYIG